MSLDLLDTLAPMRAAGTPRGLTSICSAHPLVLRAGLRNAVRTGTPALIEATCNQVNHRGGYTGMTPADFVALVDGIAAEEGCPKERIILGGDHLGPNPWRDASPEDAMREAETMVAAYVEAGFRKLHLDCSMGCRDEPESLDDATTADRAVRLAAIAEATARRAGGEMPRYVIGTEVPPPGGADHTLATVAPTKPDAVRETIVVHRRTFASAGLEAAFARVIAVVVQPGVEFGNHDVIRYDRAAASALVGVLDEQPRLVFEAHSTDYQGYGPLAELVADGFAVLKVGPELTFVLREALYALDLIASDLVAGYGARPLKAAMEALMQAEPRHWARHYQGDAAMQAILRHYSFSDRIRYYWAQPQAGAAVERLLEALRGRSVPLPLFWQHLPAAACFADSALDPEALLIWRVGRSLDAYHAACTGGAPTQ